MEPALYLKKKFREYYSRARVTPAVNVSEREFGIGEFGKKISSRHLSFKGNDELNFFLRNEVPMYISCSAAFYDFPAARPMSAKGMRGADLIYEFDADDIKTECKLQHDTWVCKSCGNSGKGGIKACTKCGGGTEVDEWVCQECLGEVKRHAKLLVEALKNDLGITDGLAFNFSGSKGYHIHVRSPKVADMIAAARVEIVDYLTANGIRPENLGFMSEGKKFLCPRPDSSSGWGSKILEGIKALLNEGREQELAVAGNITLKLAKELINKKDLILKEIDNGVLFQLPGKKTEAFWAGVIEYVLERRKLKLDRMTSIDISKIVRVPDTLHGSTGLLAKTLSWDAFGQHDALGDTVVFSETPENVSVVATPKFYLKGRWWGPFSNETVELPEYAAVYLVAKKKALPA